MLIFHLPAYIYITNIMGDDFMNDISNLITNVGFPIAISVYLLVRFEGKIEALTNSINSLTNKICNLPEAKPEKSDKDKVA